jgi:hypothetical protein
MDRLKNLFPARMKQKHSTKGFTPDEHFSSVLRETSVGDRRGTTFTSRAMHKTSASDGRSIVAVPLPNKEAPPAKAVSISNDKCRRRLLSCEEQAISGQPGQPNKSI